MRFGLHGARARGAARWLRRRGGVVGLCVALALVLVACDSTNTYPIDFFSEMHYEKSWHSQEPPRLDSPVGAVPFKGGVVNVGGALGPAQANPVSAASGTPVPLFSPNYTQDEAANLKNPLPRNAETSAMGQQLFAVNCVVCHGPEGNGDGIAAALIFKANQKPAPADLHRQDLKALTDGQLYYVLTNGFGDYMPPFGHLLTPEQRWALVIHIRELQGQ